MTPSFSNPSNSSLTGSNAMKGTFLLGLNTGFTFSFSSNFTLVFTHFSKPSENTQGKQFFRSLTSFSLFLLFEETSTLLQQEFMGSCHKSNNTIQSLLNKFDVFCNTHTLLILMFPRKEIWHINSPWKFNFFPDTPQATLFFLVESFLSVSMSKH